MARVSIYLNFPGTAEEAFTFYADVFGTQIDSLTRMGDVPSSPEGPQVAEHERDKVMNAQLEILAGTVVMATDMLESMGQQQRIGNNVTLNLEPDSLAETQRLFDRLSDGATDISPLMPMFWGSHWGTCLDRYGVRWMFNSPAESGQ
jgi:PhnB protein